MLKTDTECSRTMVSLQPAAARLGHVLTAIPCRVQIRDT